MDIHYYLRIFLRRLHWIVLFLVIGAGAGIWLAMSLPPVYQAEARMIVESEQIPDELAASTVQTAATEQIQIIEQRILTREVLLEMANRLGIYDGIPPMPAGDKVDDLRSRIEIGLKGGSRRGVSEATIVRVSFKSDDAQMSARVTNEIVTLILQENVQMRTTVSGQTLEFFSQEVDRLGQEMSRLSARILAFKEGNLDALPDSLDFRRSQQAATQERILQIDRSTANLQDRRERLVTLFADTGVLPEDRLASPEERQLAQLRQQHASSVAVLSLDNPKIAVMRARIEALEAVVAQQQEARANGAVVEEGAEAPKLPPTQLDIQLADIDGQLEALARQRVEAERQLAALTTTIEATPGNSVTLEAMERDYANLREQYNQTVANKARAETGDMIEALSKGQRISLVEQAVAPKAPVSPNRPMLAAAGTGAGLAAGIALFVLLELLNSAVRRPSEITDKLGIATLATVPFIHTRRQSRDRRRFVTGAAAAAALLMVMVAGIWLASERFAPLDQAIDGLLGRTDLARATSGN